MRLTTVLSNLTFTLFESYLVDRPNMNYITHFPWSVFYICINKLYPKRVVYQPQADVSGLHLQPVSQPKQRRLIFRSNGFCLRRFSSMVPSRWDGAFFSLMFFTPFELDLKGSRCAQFGCRKDSQSICWKMFLDHFRMVTVLGELNGQDSEAFCVDPFGRTMDIPKLPCTQQDGINNQTCWQAIHCSISFVLLS